MNSHGPEYSVAPCMNQPRWDPNSGESGYFWLVILAKVGKKKKKEICNESELFNTFNKSLTNSYEIIILKAVIRPSISATEWLVGSFCSTKL